MAASRKLVLGSLGASLGLARLAVGQVPNQPSTIEGANPDEPPSASVSAAPSVSVPPIASIRPAPHSVPLKDGMLLLPGGRFIMGTSDPSSAPNERPRHVETVAPFWIDRTEVTVGAYQACVEKQECTRPAKASAGCTYDAGDPELPVSCVRWQAADAYCRAVHKRLLRETEWEFAARGTSRIRFPWGGGGTNCILAATVMHDHTGRTCSGKRPARVGTHPAGASLFGVLDMTGNVEEWTSDWYLEGLPGGAAPRAGASHVLRGGGWLSTPSMSRTTSRNWGSALEDGPNVGIRCARSVE